MTKKTRADAAYDEVHEIIHNEPGLDGFFIVADRETRELYWGNCGIPDMFLVYILASIIRECVAPDEETTHTNALH